MAAWAPVGPRRSGGDFGKYRLWLARAMPLREREPFDLERALDARTPLHDGTSMPVLGLGVWQTPPGAATRDAVTYALESGYRLVDTASLYQNEVDVGAAIRGSEVERDAIFVTTKLWNDDQGYEPALKAFERSLRALGLAEVDLYLLHWPVSGLRFESWRALVRIQREGRCRSIGVSNFTVAHLEELRERSDIVPVVDQVEFHPFLYQPELLEYCRSEGIQLEGYSPLARGRRLEDPTIARIAQAHRRTPAQVMLRWGLQHGVVEIPKSVRPERIAENANVFGFALTDEEMAALDGLRDGYRVAWDPSRMR